MQRFMQGIVETHPARPHHKMHLFQPPFFAQIPALIERLLRVVHCGCGQMRQSLCGQGHQTVMINRSCCRNNDLGGRIMAGNKGMQMLRRKSGKACG